MIELGSLLGSITGIILGGYIFLRAFDFLPKSSKVPKRRKCPFCAEKIRVEAIKCKHCGELLGETAPQMKLPAKVQPSPEGSTGKLSEEDHIETSDDRIELTHEEIGSAKSKVNKGILWIVVGWGVFFGAIFIGGPFFQLEGKALGGFLAWALVVGYSLQFLGCYYIARGKRYSGYVIVHRDPPLSP